MRKPQPTTFMYGSFYGTFFDNPKNHHPVVLQCKGLHEFMDIETHKIYHCDVRSVRNPHAPQGSKPVLSCAIHPELEAFWSSNVIK